MSVVQGGITAAFNNIYFENLLLQTDILDIRTVTTILPAKKSSQDSKKQQETHNAEENTGFDAIFTEECAKTANTKAEMSEDIDVRTNGYTAAGMPVRMIIRMHEYTF